MAFPHRSSLLLAPVLVGTLAVFGLAGCGAEEQQAAPGPSPTASSSAAGVPTLPISTAVPDVVATGPNPGVPSDFPTDRIGLLPGAVELPLGVGSGTGPRKGWVLQLQVAKKAPDCFADAEAALLRTGFVKQPGATLDKGTREAQYIAPRTLSGGPYAVIISASPTDSGTCRLGYEVGELGAEPTP